MAFLWFIAPLLLATFVCAKPPPGLGLKHGIHKVNVTSYEAKQKYTGETLRPLDTTYYFDQLIDHNNPSRGTFQQRYWFSYSYYQSGEHTPAHFHATSEPLTTPQAAQLCS